MTTSASYAREIVHPYRSNASISTQERVPGATYAGLAIAGPLFAILAITSIRGYALNAVVGIVALLCSIAPVPGTRSHVPARIAALASLGAAVANMLAPDTPCERAPGVSALANVAWVTLWIALPCLALSLARRFHTPRWPAFIALAGGTSIATTHDFNGTELLGRYPAATTVEIAVLAMMAIAFGWIAKDWRRDLPTADPATEWSKATFAIASSLLLISSFGTELFLGSSFASFVASVVLAIALARSPGASIVLGLATFITALVLLASNGSMHAFGFIASPFAGIAIAGLGVFLTAPAGLERPVGRVKRSLMLAGILLAPAGPARLYEGRAAIVLLLVSTAFASHALHRSQAVERLSANSH